MRHSTIRKKIAPWTYVGRNSHRRDDLATAPAKPVSLATTPVQVEFAAQHWELGLRQPRERQTLLAWTSAGELDFPRCKEIGDRSNWVAHVTA